MISKSNRKVATDVTVADWNVGCGFSWFASVATSWLYGDFDVRQIESQTTVNAINLCDVKRRLNANLAVADAAIGLRWETCFCCDRRLLLGVGLEHHRYFDYNRFCDSGDLSFDGLNFSIGIEF